MLWLLSFPPASFSNSIHSVRSGSGPDYSTNLTFLCFLLQLVVLLLLLLVVCTIAPKPHFILHCLLLFGDFPNFQLIYRAKSLPSQIPGKMPGRQRQRRQAQTLLFREVPYSTVRSGEKKDGTRREPFRAQERADLEKKKKAKTKHRSRESHIKKAFLK